MIPLSNDNKSLGDCPKTRDALSYQNDSSNDGGVSVSNIFNTWFHKLNETFWGCIISNIWSLLLHFRFAFPNIYSPTLHFKFFGQIYSKFQTVVVGVKPNLIGQFFNWLRGKKQFFSVWILTCFVMLYLLRLLLIFACFNQQKDLLPWLWTLCRVAASLLWRWQ